MGNCLYGHPNAAHRDRCEQCGAPVIDDGQDAARNGARRTRIGVAAGAAAAVALVAGITAIGVRGGDSPKPPESGRNADSSQIQQWWSGAQQHVVELDSALRDMRWALKHLDRQRFRESCQTMHDASAVGLQAHVPTPDPDVTSELQAAIQDAHSAAHICLSVTAGSVNNYDGEFLADLDQAQNHLKAAQDLIIEELSSP